MVLIGLRWLPKVFFIARFNSFENRNKVVDEGSPMFDKKPVIVIPWSADLDIKKLDVSSAPVWIRIMELDLKYWGQGTLMKLGSLLGTPIKTDHATSMRELLHCAHILVDVSIDDNLPDEISFENEWGGIMHYQVEYEWRPVKCTKCNMFGHLLEECKKGNGARAWKEKGNPRETQNPEDHTRRLGKEPMEQDVLVGNTFDPLRNEAQTLMIGTVNIGSNNQLPEAETERNMGDGDGSDT